MKEVNEMINFNCEEVELTNELMELAKESVEKSLDYFDFDFEVEVALTTVTNPSIKQINKQYRQLDKATDVLSFPMIEWKNPCDLTWFNQVVDGYLNPDNGCVLLGDIVLSMDQVTTQAYEYGHSVQREFAFLLVHSMLHLLGYDHMSIEEDHVMRTYQKKILNTINYK